MPTNTGYYENSEDMQRMQQEAIRRVREMHSRARHSLDPARGYQIPSPPIQLPETVPVEKPHSVDPPAQTQSQPHGFKLGGPLAGFDVFKALTNDSEKTLILILTLLLVDEGTDLCLILALIYLII